MDDQALNDRLQAFEASCPSRAVRRSLDAHGCRASTDGAGGDRGGRGAGAVAPPPAACSRRRDMRARSTPVSHSIARASPT